MGTLIIGGGVAGLCAAAFSYQPAVVIDHLKGPGRKLLATGGGRCNISHDGAPHEIARSFGEKSRFVLPALRGFSIRALRTFFADLGLATVVESDGGVYPETMRASSVLSALLRAAERNGAELRLGCRAERLLLEGGSGGRRRVVGVVTGRGVVRPERVILAAGGQSFSELGADGSGFALAAQAGLRIVPPVPGLAALHCSESWVEELTGISCSGVHIRLELRGGRGVESRGSLLFTHRGISGPVALALAGSVNRELAAGAERVVARVNLRQGLDVAGWVRIFGRWRKEHGSRSVHNLLAGEVPRALALVLCRLAGLGGGAVVARMSRAEERKLAGVLSGLELEVLATDGWGQAMVTCGGVGVGELDPKTLACCSVENLFCAGEVVDVDGPCGGYNLSWAMASGRLAGVSQRVVD